jgi:hypothetical protein
MATAHAATTIEFLSGLYDYWLVRPKEKTLVFKIEALKAKKHQKISVKN